MALPCTQDKQIFPPSPHSFPKGFRGVLCGWMKANVGLAGEACGSQSPIGWHAVFQLLQGTAYTRLLLSIMALTKPLVKYWLAQLLRLPFLLWTHLTWTTFSGRHGLTAQWFSAIGRLNFARCPYPAQGEIDTQSPQDFGQCDDWAAGARLASDHCTCHQ